MRRQQKNQWGFRSRETRQRKLVGHLFWILRIRATRYRKLSKLRAKIRPRPKIGQPQGMLLQVMYNRSKIIKRKGYEGHNKSAPVKGERRGKLEEYADDVPLLILWKETGTGTTADCRTRWCLHL